MVRGERYKLIEYPRIGKTQLFDLLVDPDELNDCSASPAHAAVLSELRSQLKQWQVSVKDPAFNKSAASTNRR
jgi:hypothetical protein